MIRSSGSAAERYAVQLRTYVASLRILSERTGINARGRTRATRTRRRTKVVDEEGSVKDSTQDSSSSSFSSSSLLVDSEEDDA